MAREKTVGSSRRNSELPVESAGKKAGRPIKSATPGTKVSLGLKVTADIKAKLDRASKASGRTQSQEAEARLEASFRDQEDVVWGALRFAYGPELAALLILVGRTISTLSQVGNYYTGKRSDGENAWVQNPYVFDQAARAVSRYIEAFRPPGDTSFYEQPGAEPFKDYTWNFEAIGAEEAERVVGRVAAQVESDELDLRLYHSLRQLLSPEIIRRLAEFSAGKKRQ